MPIIHQYITVKNNNTFDAKSNSYKVFLNNSELQKGIDYFEIQDSKHFNIGNAKPGDRLKIDSIVSGKILGHDDSCIFKLYSSNQTLRPSCEYSLSITVENSIIKKDFKSQYSPMYSDVKNVKKLISPVIDDLEEDVEEMLFLNSRELENSLIENMIYTEFKLPQKERWVLHKTCLEILYKAYYKSSVNEGESIKTVGPITIKESSRAIQLKNFIARFQALFDSSNSAILSNGGSISSSFSKANSTKYPLKSRIW